MNSKHTSYSKVYSWSKYYGWFVVFLAACFYCYEYFLRISPSVMVTPLRETFHLNAAHFGNLVDIYYYVYTPLQFFVGLLMDRFGPRRLLSLACISCGLGALLFSISHIYLYAALGRFLIGFGSAFAFVGALKIASMWLPKNRFAFVSGAITTLGMLGAVVGDIGLAALVHRQGWRGTMADAAIVGLILFAILFLFISDKGQLHKRTMTEKMDASFPYLFRGLWHALKKPQMWCAGLVGSLLYVSLTAFAELWGIPYFRVTQHLSSAASSTLNTAIFLGWAVGGPFVGFLSDRIGSRRTVMMVGSLCAFILSIVLFVFEWHVSFVVLYGLLCLFGVATSSEVLIFAIGKELNSEKMAATSIALINAFVMMGGLVLQPMIGWVLDLGWQKTYQHGIKTYSAGDYHHAMMTIPICMFLAFVLSLFLKKDRIR